MKTHLILIYLFFASIGSSQFNSESIPNGTFDWLLHEGKIWQLTDAGIYIRDEVTLNVIDHFYIQAKGELYTEIRKDKLNNIWVGIRGVGIAKYDGQNWTIWDSHNTALFHQDYGIITIGTEADGSIWASSHTYSSADTLRIYIYKNNTWTEDLSGLLVKPGSYPEFILSPNNEFIAIVNDTILIRENNQWVGVPEYEEKMYDSYTDPCFDSQGNLWLHSSGEKILKYNSLKEKPVLVTQYPNGIHHMILDNYDNPWVTTDAYLVSIWKDQKWTSVTSLAGTTIPGYPFLLLNGKDKTMYVGQAIYAYECVVTIFENEKPVSNHYIDYALAERLGYDGNGNLWLGGNSNLFSRKNLANGSFDYFELFQFPLSEFEFIDKKFITGIGEGMYYMTNSGKLLQFEGNSWTELKKDGLSLNISDAAVSDNNKLYTVNVNSTGWSNDISVYDLAGKTWDKIDLSLFGNIRVLGIQKGPNQKMWFTAEESLGKINSDGSVDLYSYPDNFRMSLYDGFSMNSQGMIQLLANSTSLVYFDTNLEKWTTNTLSSQLISEIFQSRAYDVFSILDNKNQTWIAFQPDQGLYNGNPPLKVWNFAGGSWNKIIDGEFSNLYYLNAMIQAKDGSIILLGQNEIITIGPTGVIIGKTLVDKNLNCISDSLDKTFPNLLISASNNQGGSSFRYSNQSGNYTVVHPEGKVLVNAIVPNPFWESCNPNGIEFDLKKDSTLNYDLLVKEIIQCPSIETQVSASGFRLCRSGTLYFKVINNGTIKADSTFIIVSLPPELTFQNANFKYIDLGNQKYRFDFGSLAEFDERDFTMDVLVSCKAYIGQSLCLEVESFPNDLCDSDPLWSGADVHLSAACKNDNVEFELWNKGKAATTSALKYSLYQNDKLQQEKEYSLAQGEKLNLSIPSDGSTYRLTSNQEKNHPEEKYGLSLAVEGCNNLSGNVHRGYIDSKRNFTGTPYDLVFCFPIIGARDPNDKQVYPAGVGDKTHYIDRAEELEYTIRFQNTGNDTAFEIRILDTLDRYLDVSTFSLLQSSHPVKLEILDGVLDFRFPNIYLPDSTINFGSSNGFVKFKIKPKAKIPFGYYIPNKASIYFDVNAPVVTNQVWNIIYPDNQVATKTNNVALKDYSNRLLIYPNPTNSRITVDTKQFTDFKLSLDDLNGKKLLSKSFSGSQNIIELNLDKYSNGFYFITIIDRNGKKYFGKVVKQ